MKKALIAGVVGLGLAAAATQSLAQGYTEFDNYNAMPYMPIMFDGRGVSNATIKVTLLYQLGTATSITTMSVGPTTNINPNIFALGNQGYFEGGEYAVPGYSSGAVSFAVEAWNTAANNGAPVGYSTFAAARVGSGPGEGQWGISGIWQESSMSTQSSAPLYWSGLPGPNGAALINLVVAFPEPSTLALCGIGAAALFLTRRRASK